MGSVTTSMNSSEHPIDGSEPEQSDLKTIGDAIQNYQNKIGQNHDDFNMDEWNTFLSRVENRASHLQCMSYLGSNFLAVPAVRESVLLVLERYQCAEEQPTRAAVLFQTNYIVVGNYTLFREHQTRLLSIVLLFLKDKDSVLAEKSLETLGDMFRLHLLTCQPQDLLDPRIATSVLERLLDNKWKFVAEDVMCKKMLPSHLDPQSRAYWFVFLLSYASEEVLQEIWNMQNKRNRFRCGLAQVNLFAMGRQYASMKLNSKGIWEKSVPHMDFDSKHALLGSCLAQFTRNKTYNSEILENIFFTITQDHALLHHITILKYCYDVSKVEQILEGADRSVSCMTPPFNLTNETLQTLNELVRRFCFILDPDAIVEVVSVLRLMEQHSLDIPAILEPRASVLRQRASLLLQVALGYAQAPVARGGEQDNAAARVVLKLNKEEKLTWWAALSDNEKHDMIKNRFIRNEMLSTCNDLQLDSADPSDLKATVSFISTYSYAAARSMAQLGYSNLNGDRRVNQLYQKFVQLMHSSKSSEEYLRGLVVFGAFKSVKNYPAFIDKNMDMQEVLAELAKGAEGTLPDSDITTLELDGMVNSGELPLGIRIKLASLETLTHYLVANALSSMDVRMNNAAFDIFSTYMVARASDFSAPGAAWLRLTAGTCLLTALKHRALGINPRLTRAFPLLASLLKDDAAAVVDRFAAALVRDLVWETASPRTKWLPVNLLSLYVMGGPQEDLVRAVQARRKYIKSLTTDQRDYDPIGDELEVVHLLPDVVPEYSLHYAIWLLSSQGESVQGLERLLEALLGPGRPLYSVTLCRAIIAHMMGNLSSGQDQEQKVHATCLAAREIVDRLSLTAAYTTCGVRMATLPDGHLFTLESPAGPTSKKRCATPDK